MNLDSLSLEELQNIDPNAPDKIAPLKDVILKIPKNSVRFPSTFLELDRAMNGGFKDGDLVIISGVSGEGKTTLAQTLTYNLCLFNTPVCWFSYEVSLEHLDRKFREMGISDFYHVFVPEKNTTGKLDWVKLKIIESCAKYDTKIIFIDHIDFLSPMETKTSDNQSIALKNIATELKSLAIELGVVIVCMAHLRKLPDAKKEPDMQDIGYSAGIFQLADYVLIVWREKIEAKKSLAGGDVGELTTGNSFVKIVKNRETGTLKVIKLYYEKSRLNSFDQMPPVTQADDTTTRWEGLIPD